MKGMMHFRRSSVISSDFSLLNREEEVALFTMLSDGAIKKSDKITSDGRKCIIPFILYLDNKWPCPPV